MVKIVNGVKYYPVSEAMKFNLEACNDKMSLMIMEAEEEGDFETAEKIRADRDIADELAFKAGYGWLNGKDYGRAKELTAWRIEKRIEANISAGNFKNLQYC